MKVIEKTGLVPVKSAKTGDVFGLPPKDARKAIASGKVTLYEIPDGIKTVDLDDPKPVVEKTVVEDVIEIPDDWATMHHLKKIGLAKAISGGDLVVPEGKKMADIAEEVIVNEVQRRAVAGSASTEASL